MPVVAVVGQLVREEVADRDEDGSGKPTPAAPRAPEPVTDEDLGTDPFRHPPRLRAGHRLSGGERSADPACPPLAGHRLHRGAGAVDVARQESGGDSEERVRVPVDGVGIEMVDEYNVPTVSATTDCEVSARRGYGSSGSMTSRAGRWSDVANELVPTSPLFDSHI
jgi:hypothetical protein